MLNRRLLLLTLAILIIGSAAIIFCYHAVDRQAVLWLAAHNSRDWGWVKFLHSLAELPGYIMGYIIFGFVYIGIKVILRNYSNFDAKLTFFITTLIITYDVIGAFFKTLFGRPWPATYLGNPSFLSNGLYGFEWHKGYNIFFQSFPSGHTMSAVAIAMTASYLFPRVRYFCYAYGLFVALMMIVQYFHFVSDVIAGAMLGYLVPCYCYQFYLLVNKNASRN